MSETSVDIELLRMLHSGPRLELAQSAPALGFLVEQDSEALIRTEHVCPVPDSLVPGKRKSTNPMPLHHARFGLLGTPLKPIRVKPAKHSLPAGVSTCLRSNPHQ